MAMIQACFQLAAAELVRSGVADSGALTAQMQQAMLRMPTFAAVLVRVGAMFMFAPVFGSRQIPRRVRAMLAVTMAAAMAAVVKPVELPGGALELMVGIAGEMLFGLAMGLVVSMVFVAAQWAGEILSQQLGFSLGSVFDPQYQGGGAGGGVISDLLFMLTLVIFLCLRGHHALVIGLKASLDRLPPLSAGVTMDGGAEMVAGLVAIRCARAPQRVALARLVPLAPAALPCVPRVRLPQRLPKNRRNLRPSVVAAVGAAARLPQQPRIPPLRRPNARRCGL